MPMKIRESRNDSSIAKYLNIPDNCTVLNWGTSLDNIPGIRYLKYLYRIYFKNQFYLSCDSPQFYERMFKFAFFSHELVTLTRILYKLLMKQH